MNMREAVKERILELCCERNITINKLATLSGVTQSTLNNIISGRNRSTTISTIKKIVRWFGYFDGRVFFFGYFRSCRTGDSII